MLQSPLQSQTIVRQFQDLEKTVLGPSGAGAGDSGSRPGSTQLLPAAKDLGDGITDSVLSPVHENLQQMAAAGGPGPIMNSWSSTLNVTARGQLLLIQLLPARPAAGRSDGAASCVCSPVSLAFL
jgi:hypothetical protein